MPETWRSFGRFESRLHERVMRAVQGRILVIDQEDALLYDRLTGKARRQGRPARVGDGQIAAIALRHGVAVATRNTSDFFLFEKPLIDPWQAPR